MRHYGWIELLMKFVLRPKSLIAFRSLPRIYTSLDQWLAIDGLKCKIVAEVIHCQCADSLWKQQKQNMECRATVAKDFNDWMQKVKLTPSLGDPIACIAEEFAFNRKCHRRYRNPGAGVYCYCDEHNH